MPVLSRLQGFEVVIVNKLPSEADSLSEYIREKEIRLVFSPPVFSSYKQHVVNGTKLLCQVPGNFYRGANPEWKGCSIEIQIPEQQASQHN